MAKNREMKKWLEGTKREHQIDNSTELLSKKTSKLETNRLNCFGVMVRYAEFQDKS